MSLYKTITVDAALTSNTIGASPNINGNVSASGIFTTNIQHNSVSDYELLTNKPQINSVELIGNRSLPDIGVDTISNMELEILLH